MSATTITASASFDESWLTLFQTKRSIRVLALIGVIIVNAYLIGLPAGDAGALISNLIFTALSAGAAVLCFRTARKLGPAGRPWRFMGLGCAAWFLGQLVWNWYDIIRWTSAPYPSVADIGYTLFYPLTFAGLALLIRHRIGDLPTFEVVVDSLIVVVAFALIAHEFVLLPLVGPGALSAWTLVITLAWEVSAIALVVLTGVALFLRSDLLTRGPLALLMLGFLCFTTADVIYGRLAIEGAYSSGQLVDIGWQSGFVFLALAAVVAAQGGQTTGRPIDLISSRRLAIARVTLMVLSVLIVTGIAVYSASRPSQDGTMVVLMALAGVLLAVRMGYAPLQTEHLARRTRERDRLAGVVAASSAISATLDLEHLLEGLAAAAAAAVGRSRAEVHVFSEDMSGVELSARAGFTVEESAIFQSLTEAPIGAFPAEARVIATLRPTTQPIDEPGIPPADAELFRRFGKRHTLVAPLLAHGRVLGVFDIWTPFDATPFDPADVAAAAAVGQQAGLAIHNARLLARARRHATEQESLLRVSQAAASSLDLDAVLAEIAHASLGVAEAEACSIEIWDPEHDCTILAAEATIDTWPGTSPTGARLPLDRWPTSRRVLEEQLTVNLLVTDPGLSQIERDHFNADGTRSLLMIPLVIDGACLGALDLFSRSPRYFTDDEIRLASDLAAQVAVAIDRARLHEALRERADTDGLTGARNHRSILEALDLEIARSRRNGAPIAVMMVDLDGFKQVNDTYGHQIGDQVLRETAGLLRANIREFDHAGRYGGDEFLLILTDTDADRARQIASRILDMTDEAAVIAGIATLPINLSIGIAVLPDDGVTRQELIAVSDARMYESKAARRWIGAGSFD